MEQRDLLKEEIDRLGRVLGLILERLLDRSSKGEILNSPEQAQQETQHHLGFNLEELASLNEETFWQQLQATYTLDAIWVNQLGDLFFELANLKDQQGQRALPFWHKSLLCYQWVEEQATVYSMDRQFRIAQAKEKLAAE